MSGLLIADARTVSGPDFFRLLTGQIALTPAQRAQNERDRQEWIEQRKAECRRELEALRDRLCEQASPDLAARFRAKWAAEDAAEQRRAAA